jgi:poly(3-hydroxybutyrate) depolymerase
LVAPPRASRKAAPAAAAEEEGAPTNTATAPSTAGASANGRSDATVDLDTPVVPDGVEDRLVGARGRTITVAAHPRAGAPTETATWRIVTSREGALDLASGLSVKAPGEAFALLSGVVHVSTRIEGALLIGASDGIRVYVDGKQIANNDDRRPERDDEYIFPVTWSPGNHPVLIKLRRRAGSPYPWNVRVRLVDSTLRAPKGARLVLPGTDDHDARTIAAGLLSVQVDRGLREDGLHPRAIARFTEGAPRGVDSDMTVRATGESQLFRVRAGRIPVADNGAGAGELAVTLPPLKTDEILPSGAKEGRVTFTVDAAGRSVQAQLTMRRSYAEAIAAANEALGLADRARSPFLDDPAAVAATISYLRDRLATYVDRGDEDASALADEAETLIDYRDDLKNGRDPLRSHTGIRRFAYDSPLDGAPAQFGIYVPPSYKPGTQVRYPLIVALHGMNGKPISMLTWFFGHDDGRDVEQQDRHPGEVPPIEAFVVAPNGYGNGMYRDLGEVDVMAVLDWAERFYPIDRRKITITGLSMGGTGTASVAFHYPDKFAAAEPLCGYHSYLIRGDLAGLPKRPWEKLLAEQRSNVLWAENGLHMPLYVWHGQRDWPVANSGVLINRYNELGFSIADEHPNVGHDVWKNAYRDLGGYRWLEPHLLPEAPTHVVFKTDSLRYAKDYWITIDDLGGQLEFGKVDATANEPRVAALSTENVLALTLDRAAPLAIHEPVEVRIDGDVLSFGEGAPLSMHRDPASGHWVSGRAAPPTSAKHAGLSGPLRDVFYEPLVFAYGTLDPDQAQVNEEVARYFARVRWGVDVRYPVVADTDVDDATAASHSLFLIGNAETNRIVRDLDARLPFHVTDGAIEAGGRTYRGDELGVAFIYPNPDHPDRYVVVVEGTTSMGTFRSTFLPDLLPDWMVYDRHLAPSRSPIILGPGRPVAAGLFDRSWKLVAPTE